MSADTKTSFLLFSVPLLWSTSKVLNIFFSRFKLPSVLGELFAGLLFGLVFQLLPETSWLGHQISLIRTSDALAALGELGIILLLFEVGLETELEKITSVGKEALLVALGGVVAPFFFAWLINFIFHFGWSGHLVLFIGLVFAATSIGITARVFKDLNLLSSLNSQIILGAAVIDDVIGLVLLAVVTSIVGSEGFSLLGLFLTVFKASLFLGLSIWFGGQISSFIPWIGNLGRSDSLGFLIWVLTFVLLLSFLASVAGLAPIIGAFAAGVALDKVKIQSVFGETKSVEDYIAPIRAVLAPIFFIKVGLAVDPKTMIGMLPLVLTVVACVSKLVSGWLFVPFKTSMNRLIVGVGMMPRGEVGLVVTSIGASIGILSNDLYSALLVAVIMTTLIAPLWLQLLLNKKESVAKEISL